MSWQNKWVLRCLLEVPKVSQIKFLVVNCSTFVVQQPKVDDLRTQFYNEVQSAGLESMNGACLVYVGGVNRIGDKSRLSATENFETVLSSLEMRCEQSFVLSRPSFHFATRDLFANAALFSLQFQYIEDYWKQSRLVANAVHITDNTRQVSCPRRWCELGTTISSDSKRVFNTSSILYLSTGEIYWTAQQFQLLQSVVSRIDYKGPFTPSASTDVDAVGVNGPLV